MNQQFGLDNFDKHSKQEWIDQVSAELKGADPYQKLKWFHDDKVEIKPIYFSEDVNEKTYSSSRPSSSNSWSNLIEIDFARLEDNLNDLSELQSFYDGYWIDLGASGNIDEQLWAKMPKKKVYLLQCAEPSVIATVSSLLDEDAQGAFGFDPLLSSTNNESAADQIRTIIDAKGENLPEFSIITIHGNDFVDTGASIVQEIGIGMSLLAEYYSLLISAGVEKSEVARQVEWTTSIGHDHFHEIAKCRAILKLARLIQSTFDITLADIKINAVTSARSKTTLEEPNNIIRSTTEAMSAVIGGCSSLCVKPHSIVDGGKDAQRLALNVSNLIKEESFLNRVEDPAAGSYYLEVLTDELAASAWSYFQEIERNGGFVEAKKTGWIDQEIEQHKQKLQHQMEEGSLNLIGVNKFPADEENSSAATDTKTFRLAQPFERK